MSIHKTVRNAGAALLLATISSSFTATFAFAQAGGACFQGPARMNDEAISAFTGNPAALLSDNPTGGLRMSSEVRALVGSSEATLDLLLSTVPQANADQKAAMGTGLARAARACAPVNPEYAGLIQQKVAELNSPELLTAFLAASNEVQTAALGAIGAVGGGGDIGGGGGGGGGLGSAGIGGDTTVGQSGAPGFVASGGGFSSGNDGTSVSPTN
ncbi:hypothetical protein [Ciceribacter sp. L1K22]|uniref:hypothetical protein n=1 Tax=Ciceribacter sp. L1K22 TaxID=2820275 RepID=UPI001ABE8764|nr:hypothetical protein [Ciceribacter sp. L1K22]MBO3762229.1 hypothetical protein [Ciceribacter sp. L1K22]